MCCFCAGNTITPLVSLDLHYVPVNVSLQYFGKFSAFFLLAMLLLNGCGVTISKIPLQTFARNMLDTASLCAEGLPLECARPSGCCIAPWSYVSSLQCGGALQVICSGGELGQHVGHAV